MHPKKTYDLLFKTFQEMFEVRFEHYEKLNKNKIMKNIKEQLEYACSDYFIDNLTPANASEARRRYFLTYERLESENKFYQMIVNDLIKLIDKKVFISKWGAFAEGDEIQILNPDLFIGSDQEYHVKAKVIIHNDEWALDYNDNIYNFNDVSVDNF